MSQRPVAQWNAAERARTQAELLAMVAMTTAQWRAAMGLDAPAANASTPPATQLFVFDLSRITPIENRQPVFILGEARSGTTAMLRALRDGAGLFGWSEGHLFDALPPLISGVRFHLEQYRQRTIQHDGEYALEHFDVYSALNAMILAFDQTYASAAKGARWVDKTPSVGTLLAVPLLARVYPRGRFIFMHRHPIALIESRRRKFPESPIESGIKAWAATMETWRALRQLLPRENFVEIAQASMLSDAAGVAHAVQRTVELTDEQIQGAQRFLEQERPEATTSASAKQDSLYVEETDWPQDVKDWFIQLCATSAREFGYQIQRAEAT